MLKNKLGITSQVELNREEERLSKLGAKALYDSGELESLEVGRFSTLATIHERLFEAVYDFAGEIRHLNIAKGDFRFVPALYLEAALQQIDQMPHHDFDSIVEKYVEMNVAHPFREGNGRATRIWLDMMFKETLGQRVDWNEVDKEEYLSAMRRSPVKDLEIKALLKSALTTDTSRATFMKGIDVSYYYEGYSEFKVEEL